MRFLFQAAAWFVVTGVLTVTFRDIFKTLRNNKTIKNFFNPPSLPHYKPSKDVEAELNTRSEKTTIYRPR